MGTPTKTIEELYNEVIASDDLKKEFCSLKPEEVENFAEKYGCRASFDEVKAFLAVKANNSGELSDEELGQAAGGKTASNLDIMLSVCTIGIACANMAAFSAINGKCGTAIEGEGFLCEK